ERGNAKYNFDTEVKNGVVNTVELFSQMDDYVKSSLSEREKSDLAYSAVKVIMEKLTDIAIDNAGDTKKIGITGGVSYNIPIIEMVEKKLRKEGFELITHNTIPNGDGGIAIGQNVIVGELLS
ncbi:MAG: carbamoyltransferase HypF, partial [Methanomicrobia archaeon]|nr:carbamoyltransferase HypF [Methanomicrobia archaeon]